MSVPVLERTLTVKMFNGQIWEIPVRAIAMHYVKHHTRNTFGGNHELCLKYITKEFADSDEVIEYAKDEMGWFNLKDYAKWVNKPDFDYEHGFLEGYMTVNDNTFRFRCIPPVD